MFSVVRSWTTHSLCIPLYLCESVSVSSSQRLGHSSLFPLVHLVHLSLGLDSVRCSLFCFCQRAVGLFCFHKGLRTAVLSPLTNRLLSLAPFLRGRLVTEETRGCQVWLVSLETRATRGHREKRWVHKLNLRPDWPRAGLDQIQGRSCRVWSKFVCVSGPAGGARWSRTQGLIGKSRYRSCSNRSNPGLTSVWPSLVCSRGSQVHPDCLDLQDSR